MQIDAFRLLADVAMTRHRDGVQLYAAQDEFTNAGQTLAAGRLVGHGAAPYEHDSQKSDSYFVTLENAKGERNTIWGVDLERAMKGTERAPEIGDRIGLQHMGSEPVRLPDGTETHRNTWKVQDAGELAYDQLERRLSRSGVKETTLDYTSDFAERRGIAERNQLSGGDAHGSMPVAAASSLAAVVWNFLYNTAFEAWERRNGVTKRRLVHRIAHALGFEGGLVAILIPLFMWWYQVGLLEALRMEVALLVFFFVFTFVFTWIFDRLVPMAPEAFQKTA